MVTLFIHFGGKPETAFEVEFTDEEFEALQVAAEVRCETIEEYVLRAASDQVAKDLKERPH